MEVCKKLEEAKEQLDKLQFAYAEHLRLEGRNRLKWMEREIDQQQERVQKLTRFVDEIRPFGCLGCEHQYVCVVLQNRVRRHR